MPDEKPFDGRPAPAPNEAWRLFKIIAEAVDGIETLSSLKGCVSIFGASRSRPDSAMYKETVSLARLLAENGYGIITGGGPGLMEAANKGACEGGGDSIGLHIHLPHEQHVNEYVKIRCDFRYFFIRKLMFVKYAAAYVVMPGGMGTLDEFSEAFVLVQTKRIQPIPIILYGKEFWEGLLDWVRKTIVRDGYMREEELELCVVKDSPEEVLRYLQNRVPL